MNKAKKNKDAIEKSFASWTYGLGGPLDLLAEDAVWTIAGNSLAAGTYAGRDAYLREVILPFYARMDMGLSPVIREIHAEGDSVIVRFDARGTARDGRPYENSHAWFLEMKAGRIVRATAYFDSIEFDALWQGVAPAGAEPHGALCEA